MELINAILLNQGFIFEWPPVNYNLATRLIEHIEERGRFIVKSLLLYETLTCNVFLTAYTREGILNLTFWRLCRWAVVKHVWGSVQLFNTLFSVGCIKFYITVVGSHDLCSLLELRNVPTCMWNIFRHLKSYSLTRLYTQLVEVPMNLKLLQVVFYGVTVKKHLT